MSDTSRKKTCIYRNMIEVKSDDSFEDEVNLREDFAAENEIKDDLKPSMMRCRSFLLVLSSASTRSSDSWDSIKARMSKKST